MTRSLLDRAESGRLREWCRDVHAAHPYAPATQIRELALATFGKTVAVNGEQVPMPPVRSFQRCLKRWRDERRQARWDKRRAGA
ncbi:MULTISPECIES: hypothetical protein [unclassified Labrenzia]|uniref:hypothetical protein n=1 Tax=unclassified Labrenzia TaxID=2648686 RepID=UPI0012691756|nr:MULTISPECIES: hypothetical protein [unclassified Labrenzia]